MISTPSSVEMPDLRTIAICPQNEDISRFVSIAHLLFYDLCSIAIL